MMENQEVVPKPQRKLFTMRREYLDAVDQLLAMAKHELCVFDPDLLALQFNAPERIDVLRRLLASNKNHRVRIALHDVEHVNTRCARLLQLIATFPASLMIQCTQGEATRAQDCFVIADGENVARRPAAAQARGVLLLDDPNEGHAMSERFEQIWESSYPAVSATKTGL
ncbi:MAG: hypothetical protein HYY28_11340 [Betaproteobacteria bacterium]|nr:hypothetical protein [Betaproteobacteria bacterium]